MKDNFDLKKFLKENKTMENSNPYLAKELNEEANKNSLRKKIREMVEEELKEMDSTMNFNISDEDEEYDPVYEAKEEEETEEVETETEETEEEAPSTDPKEELKDLDQAVKVAKEIDGELAIQIDNDIKYLDKIESRELRSGGGEEESFEKVEVVDEFEEEE